MVSPHPHHPKLQTNIERATDIEKFQENLIKMLDVDRSLPRTRPLLYLIFVFLFL